jgi:hypothetical protein
MHIKTNFLKPITKLIMKNKRLFQVLDEMNLEDIEKATRLVSISNTVVRADIVKAGAHVTIGTDSKCFHDINSGKAVAILVIVDIEEYNKRK